MKCLLVDGTNMVMRYAFAALSAEQANASDQDVARVLGSVEHGIRSCATEIGATHVIVAVDSPRSWRRDRYPAYKAGRQTSTGVWVERLTEWLKSAKILVASSDGFEADDVVAALATRLRGRADIAALSADSDLLALGGEIDCYQFGAKGEPRFVHRSKAWIAEKFGVIAPDLITDFKALAGESGDNLPGVPGIGPVKARKLLRDYGTCAAMLQQKVLDPEPISTMLELVTLRADAPLPLILPTQCAIARETVGVA